MLSLPAEGLCRLLVLGCASFGFAFTHTNPFIWWHIVAWRPRKMATCIQARRKLSEESNPTRSQTSSLQNWETTNFWKPSGLWYFKYTSTSVSHHCLHFTQVRHGSHTGKRVQLRQSSNSSLLSWNWDKTSCQPEAFLLGESQEVDRKRHRSHWRPHVSYRTLITGVELLFRNCLLLFSYAINEVLAYNKSTKQKKKKKGICNNFK